MFSSRNVFVYIILIISIIFLGLYILRRINCIKCYADILEKKVINLKKENKELHSMISCDKAGKCTMKDADILMNKIFMDIEKKDSATEIVKVTDIPKVVTPSVTPPVTQAAMRSSNTSSVLDNIIATSATSEYNVDVADVTDVADIESVISDAINSGIYNRKKLTKMNLDRLKDVCSSLNISADGTKNTLIDRILAQEQK
jgi:hypothetical protein